MMKYGIWNLAGGVEFWEQVSRRRFLDWEFRRDIIYCISAIKGFIFGFLLIVFTGLLSWCRTAWSGSSDRFALQSMVSHGVVISSSGYHRCAFNFKRACFPPHHQRVPAVLNHLLPPSISRPNNKHPHTPTKTQNTKCDFSVSCSQTYYSTINLSYPPLTFRHKSLPHPHRIPFSP
jgi:hypothetical protein